MILSVPGRFKHTGNNLFPRVAHNSTMAAMQVNSSVSKNLDTRKALKMITNLIHSLWAKMYIFLAFYLSGHLSIFSFVNSLPLVRKLSFQIRIFLYALVKLLFFLLILKIFYSLGYLFMDELQRAVAQFYPSTSGGIHEGGFSQPPTTPPENSGLGLIPGAQSEEDRPDSNHYASGSSQEAKEKLLAILKRHLRKHCASQAVAQKYPYLKDLKQDDFNYFAQHIAISELEIESKTDREIAELADYILNYNRVKTLLDLFFETDFF